MILENQVSSPFAAKVRQIASRLGVPPDYLMAVMWSESRLDPAATNPEGGATGLIQFMPATAAGLGTSCEALREMSALDQLDYVERFFRPYAPRCHTFGDFYMACFFPAAIGKEDDYVLQTRKLSAERIRNWEIVRTDYYPLPDRLNGSGSQPAVKSVTTIRRNEQRQRQQNRTIALATEHSAGTTISEQRTENIVPVRSTGRWKYIFYTALLATGVWLIIRYGPRGRTKRPQ